MKMSRIPKRFGDASRFLSGRHKIERSQAMQAINYKLAASKLYKLQVTSHEAQGVVNDYGSHQIYQPQLTNKHSARQHHISENNTRHRFLSMSTSNTAGHGQLEPPIDPAIGNEPGPVRVRKKPTGRSIEKQKQWTKAYLQSEKGREHQERVKARRRHHNALRKASRMADKKVEEARICGRPPSLIAELEAHSREAREQLSAYEEEKAAEQEARRAGAPERQRLQHERQKVLKREYSRRMRAEKKRQETAGDGSRSDREAGCESDVGQMEEDEGVVMGDE